MHAVLLNGSHGLTVYGPFDDKETAELFAGFLSAEVDPAQALPIVSPVRELLGWREAHQCGEWSS